MSWIFGLGGNKNRVGEGDVDESDASTRFPADNNNPTSSATDQRQKSTESTYRFDSAALERAAKAAKELEKSAHAKEAFDLAKTQEKTKQLELEATIKQFGLQEEQMKLEQAQRLANERRALLEEETKQANQRAKYQDELARRRHADQLNQQRSVQNDILRDQETSVAKQEEIKKRTIEYEAELKHEYDMKRLKAELKGRAEVERENRDIYLEQIKLKASEHRRTVMEGFQTFGTMMGSGIRFMIDDPSKLIVAAGGISLVALGVYTSKTATSLIGKYVSSRIGRPALIRDTSRLCVTELIKHPIKALKSAKGNAEDSLKGVFLEPNLEARLRELAVSTRNTKLNKGLFRNILMHGPPGTGKTLFAKKLAQHSGLDYAILTGGDVAPLGSEAVSSIHNVFDWAKASRRGLLLFMDEADAFLRKRATQDIHEDLRAALNAFLYRTGEQSDKFMLMLASNEPEQFDWAINDRIDDIVTFKLPEIEERKRMIFYYFDKYIISSLQKSKRKIKVGDYNFADICDTLAEKTSGFSGRELSKLIVSCQAAAFASEDCILTQEMIMNKLNQACNAHQKKEAWNVEAKLPSQQIPT